MAASAASTSRIAAQSGPVAPTLTAPTASLRNAFRRSIASAAVASVPRVAAARCIWSWSAAALSAIAMICAWLTAATAVKDSRSRPSHLLASGVPSLMISLERSSPSTTSRARHATRPARSWLMSTARPSARWRRASTSQRSGESQGRWCSITAAASFVRPGPRRTPVRASRRAACQLVLPASFGPLMTVIPWPSSRVSSRSGPKARAITRSIHIGQATSRSERPSSARRPVISTLRRRSSSAISWASLANCPRTVISAAIPSRS